MSSTAAYWPVRLIEPRTPTGSAQQVVAGDAWRCPASGRTSVARMRTIVVLPAPFGPSRAKTEPGLDGEVDVVERGVPAEGLGDARRR